MGRVVARDSDMSGFSRWARMLLLKVTTCQSQELGKAAKETGTALRKARRLLITNMVKHIMVVETELTGSGEIKMAPME